MKKTFLSIAILASSVFAFAATNNTSDKNTAPAPTEQTAPAKPAKGQKADKKQGCTYQDRLFEGIDLTDSQKERLAALKEMNRTERTAAKKDGKERGENLTEEQREQMKAERTSSRRSFLAEVKEILTPEQYVTFLENSFMLDRGNHKAHRAHKGDGKKGDRKHDSSDKRGNRPDKTRS